MKIKGGAVKIRIGTERKDIGKWPVKVDLTLKDDKVYRGAPFTVVVEIENGKEWVKVKDLTTQLYIDAHVPDERTLAKFANMGIMVLNIASAAGEILGGGGGGTIPDVTRTVRVVFHQYDLKRGFKLAPGERKVIEVTPTFPDDLPMPGMGFASMRADLELSNGLKVSDLIRITLSPDLYKSAPLMVLEERYGFKEKGLVYSGSVITLKETPPLQPVNGERFVLVPKERPYRSTREISLTATDLGDGRMEYLLAFEMYDNPGGLIKGRHETVMTHFTLRKDSILGEDMTVNKQLLELNIRKAFAEAEVKFMEGVYSVKL